MTWEAAKVNRLDDPSHVGMPSPEADKVMARAPPSDGASADHQMPLVTPEGPETQAAFDHTTESAQPRTLVAGTAANWAVSCSSDSAAR